MDGNLPTSQQPDIDLLRQQDQHQFEIAQLGIQANLQNGREARAHFDKINENGKTIVLTVIGAAFVFGMFALYLGKEAFLSDVLKVIIGAFGGAGIGYMFGKRKQ